MADPASMKHLLSRLKHQRIKSIKAANETCEGIMEKANQLEPFKISRCLGGSSLAIVNQLKNYYSTNVYKPSSTLAPSTEGGGGYHLLPRFLL